MTDMNIDDIMMADANQPIASDAQIAQLRDMAVHMERLEDAIKNGEKKIKEWKKELTTLSQETLPNKMAELGIPGIDLTTGRRIQIEPIVAAKMPKKEESEVYARAIKWLDAHNLGDIVKREIAVSFGKESEEQSKRVMEEIKRITNGEVPVFERQDVHYQTLNATLKEEQRQGRPLPSGDDGFDIYVGPRAKLVRS